MNTPPSFPLTIFYPYTTFEYISLYQAIESTCHHKAHHDAYFDPFATFDTYERRLILPPPFLMLYPGEAVEGLPTFY